MPDPQSALLHAFLTRHPAGQAVARHAGYGKGHPVHDAHAQGSGNLQSVSPSLMRTEHGPLNPQLMRQLMAAGSGGPGAAPLPLPEGSPPPAMPGAPPGPMPGAPSGPPPMPGRG